MLAVLLFALPDVFPCFSCGNPGGQIDSTIDYLAKYNISNSPGGSGPNTYGRMWLGAFHSIMPSVRCLVDHSQVWGVCVSLSV